MTSTPEQIEWQNKWIAALRSGEYAQTNSQLIEDLGAGEVGYCCLGVAALIAAEVTRQPLALDMDYDNQSSLVLSGWKAMELFGFGDSHGLFAKRVPNPKFNPENRIDEDDEGDCNGNPETIPSFVDANDGAGLTFEQIADLAEANRDKVFV